MARYDDESIVGYEHKEWTDPIQRFTQISDFTLDIIKDTYNPKIYIEGYSFGSKGQGLFQIAENCGILKHKLLLNKNTNYTTIVPSVVKKRATNKGNANKELMYNAISEESNVPKDYQKTLRPKSTKLTNPTTDIVDSYWICKYGWKDSIA